MTAAPQAGGVPAPPQGYALSPAAFRRLARIVQADSGIRLTEAKQSLVVSRLSRRLRSLGLGGFEQYCNLVEAPDGAGERQRMISSLTTNVTRFFREEHHFRQLGESVLPPLVARARAGGRVRLWSAGCSSGEEPYSIALTLLDLCPEAPRLDLRILASDIDPDVLEKAQQGRYPPQAAAAVPARLLDGFLKGSDGASIEIGAAARGLVTFRQLNLLERWPFQGRFDIIFCRNVVIYFDAVTQDTLWQRFAGVLVPGGHLFIGHSERLSPAAQPQFQNAGVTCYQRCDPAPPGVRSPAATPGTAPGLPESGRTRGWV
ncbi:protein-glutamate O-methyltransferase [Alkalilacustris brevis]|uniref:protein-glutamate O-methyltransferase n=1 Tax=Alkalilacustris brevis TaxID=2026338 RepID=UPI000E0D3D57|nr:protein-glutamate O-methyltransferase [Alkalilacustris brevis]